MCLKLPLSAAGDGMRNREINRNDGVDIRGDRQVGSSQIEFGRQRKSPDTLSSIGAFCMRSLAVTYSGMAESHTTIGAERFHFRVRNGIGWFPFAIAARQNR